jgi:hypothetical protein
MSAVIGGGGVCLGGLTDKLRDIFLPEQASYDCRSRTRGGDILSANRNPGMIFISGSELSLSSLRATTSQTLGAAADDLGKHYPCGAYDRTKRLHC